MGNVPPRFFNTFNITTLRRTNTELRTTASEYSIRCLSPVLAGDFKESLIASIRHVLIQLLSTQSALNALIGDIRRSWSARLDDDSGRLVVGTALNPHFIQDQTLFRKSAAS